MFALVPAGLFLGMVCWCWLMATLVSYPYSVDSYIFRLLSHHLVLESDWRVFSPPTESRCEARGEAEGLSATATFHPRSCRDILFRWIFYDPIYHTSSDFTLFLSLGLSLSTVLLLSLSYSFLYISTPPSSVEFLPIIF